MSTLKHYHFDLNAERSAFHARWYSRWQGC